MADPTAEAVRIRVHFVSSLAARAASKEPGEKGSQDLEGKKAVPIVTHSVLKLSKENLVSSLLSSFREVAVATRSIDPSCPFFILFL